MLKNIEELYEEQKIMNDHLKFEGLIKLLKKSSNEFISIEDFKLLTPFEIYLITKIFKFKVKPSPISILRIGEFTDKICKKVIKDGVFNSVSIDWNINDINSEFIRLEYSDDNPDTEYLTLDCTSFTIVNLDDINSDFENLLFKLNI